MKMMKNVLYLALIAVLLFSCETTEEKPVVKDVDNTPQVGEIEHIETLFDEVSFSSDLELKLLKELDVCDTIYNEETRCATCSPKYFKIVPFKKKSKLEDAFMLQVKALTILKGQEVSLPMRHLILFERENGELVKVNGFRGNLIATRVSDKEADDLIIRFYIPEDGAFLNCLFEWNGKQYKFKSVEAIDGAGGHGSVKESVKDSISKVVYQSLMSNTMIF